MHLFLACFSEMAVMFGQNYFAKFGPSRYLPLKVLAKLLMLRNKVFSNRKYQVTFILGPADSFSRNVPDKGKDYGSINSGLLLFKLK